MGGREGVPPGEGRTGHSLVEALLLRSLAREPKNCPFPHSPIC
jgi:hypothetical protein